MEQGSFSRGDDKGTLSAEAGIVFNGNLDGDVETHRAHLATCSCRCRTRSATTWPSTTAGTPICPAGRCRRCSPTTSPITWASSPTTWPRSSTPAPAPQLHRCLRPPLQPGQPRGGAGPQGDRADHLGADQADPPRRHCSKAEVEEYLTFAIEVRRRVKEQLKRMGGIEYSRVNLSYIDKPTGQETFVTCKELGSSRSSRKARSRRRPVHRRLRPRRGR